MLAVIRLTLSLFIMTGRHFNNKIDNINLSKLIKPII